MALPAGQGLFPVTDSLHESERLGEGGGQKEKGEGRWDRVPFPVWLLEPWAPEVSLALTHLCALANSSR